MKQFVTILFVLVSALALAEAARLRRDEKYTTAYDNVDVDEILASDRLVINYFKCLMGNGKCSPEGAELKSHITDALENDCGKCSDSQRGMVEKVIRHLFNEKTELWKQLQEKYDPENKYATKYGDRLKKITT
ncbi:Ejaculatory bulb-specific protein 3 [Zootermopsis nevadensis]|uniref:Ejaculatory bulb-specific protein 3 n=2 Tax=Zootermopsis nevadensis TaxID=136037 RepID=A0A067RPJ6_ZOONE|nr:Ejaculatory bulb-specific protein 3 [Zootermopsis nevadensis]